MDTPAAPNTPPATMKALRAHQRGGPEQLVFEEAPRPEAGAGEVLVAVHAAAITFAELTWPETWESQGVDRTPVIPSHEMAGVVAAVSEGVTGFAVGERVFGLVPFNRDGAAAEFVAVPADCVAPLASGVSDADAAAAVLPALTAWEALREQWSAGADGGEADAGTAAAQRILIRGGTGAVGAFLTQFAHRTGAEVTVTVSSVASENRARELGADHVLVLPSHSAAPESLAGFDLAIDAVGDTVPEWLYAAVRPGGRLLVLQEPPTAELAEKYGVDAVFFVVSTRRDRLDELSALLAEGGVEVAIAQTFPLSAGRAAYASGSQPKPAPGKTVILVPGPTDH